MIAALATRDVHSGKSWPRRSSQEVPPQTMRCSRATRRACMAVLFIMSGYHLQNAGLSRKSQRGRVSSSWVRSSGRSCEY